ncbi:hypothetical protein F5B20DRAFT_542142 [Whalleya microplaca]|nr:hypothetical protein F5B20DRAFT_542142 [Whalleya microplaca]
MEPSSPGASYELGNLTSARANAEPSTFSPGDGESTLPPSPSSKGDKPKVRFHDPAAGQEFTDTPRSKDRKEPPQPSSVQKPRPALSRNPSSYNVNSDQSHDEPLSSEKARPATASTQRGITPVIITHQPPENIGPDPYGSPRRWSLDSDLQSDSSYTGLPMDNDSQDATTLRQRRQSRRTSEAEELLRAHRQTLASPIFNAPVSTNTDLSEASFMPEHHSRHRDTRGGVFYQILQTYKHPQYDLPHENNKMLWSPDSRPGTPNPSRRKWYQQPEKEARSQETLARLVGASTRLANPNEKAPPRSSPPEMRKRPGHKRTASGRIMSMVGLAQDDDARITVHVADILQRQKYIIKMCRALMLFGAPTHRLEEYLSTTAKVLEIDSQFLYIPGCMIISFDDVLTHTAEVKIVRTVQGVNLGKLKDIHEIYKEVLHDVINLDEALLRLDTVIKAKDQFPVWLCVIMYGLASASVSTFFKSRLIDMPIIFGLGMLLGVLQLVLAPRSKTYSTIFEVSAAIVMTFLARAIASLRGGSLFCFSALAQSSIAMILPGWLVLSSALELQSKAVVPGSIRMVYAIIYSLFLGYGITVGAALYGAMDSNATSETTCQNPMNTYWSILLVPLYVFFTTFTVQAKWKQMPAMIAIALAGYIVNFYSSKKFAGSVPIAYTFGAFTIGVLANLYSRMRHGVAAAVLLPAVYVQVPGSLASSGAIVSGLQTANSITHSNGSGASQDSQLNAIVFNVAASMIQIAIGITIGLFMSALIIYPLGKRRSGLWTL